MLWVEEGRIPVTWSDDFVEKSSRPQLDPTSSVSIHKTTMRVSFHVSKHTYISSIYMQTDIMHYLYVRISICSRTRATLTTGGERNNHPVRVIGHAASLGRFMDPWPP